MYRPAYIFIILGFAVSLWPIFAFAQSLTYLNQDEKPPLLTPVGYETQSAILLNVTTKRHTERRGLVPKTSCEFSGRIEASRSAAVTVEARTGEAGKKRLTFHVNKSNIHGECCYHMFSFSVPGTCSDPKIHIIP